MATYTITVSYGVGGSISPETTIVNEGDNLVLTISADVGYEISDVSVDGFSLGSVTSHTFEDIHDDYSITATFSEIAVTQYTITSTTGVEGTISPLGETLVNSGDNQSYTITPEAGFLVDQLIIDGIPEVGSTTYDFINVTEDHTIEVVFKVDIGETTYTIDIQQRNGGVIREVGETNTPSEVVIIESGDVFLSIEPDLNYSISDVLVDDVSVGSVSTYDFINVLSNHNIRPVFTYDTANTESCIKLMKTETITIIRRDFSQGSYVDGFRVPGPDTEFTMLAHVQPGNTEHGLQAVGFQVIQEKDYDRLNQSWKFYTYDEVKPKDLIRLSNGDEFEVLDVDDWTRYSLRSINYRTMARRIKEQ